MKSHADLLERTYEHSQVNKHPRGIPHWTPGEIPHGSPWGISEKLPQILSKKVLQKLKKYNNFGGTPEVLPVGTPGYILDWDGQVPGTFTRIFWKKNLAATFEEISVGAFEKLDQKKFPDEIPEKKIGRILQSPEFASELSEELAEQFCVLLVEGKTKK